MSAVKVFFSDSHHTLGSDLQAWLDHSEITIHGITMDSNQYGHCLAVLYEPGAGRRYAAQIFFASRHADLEAASNQGFTPARTGAAQLVAVGSNQYGHCLCVIREV